MWATRIRWKNQILDHSSGPFHKLWQCNVKRWSGHWKWRGRIDFAHSKLKISSKCSISCDYLATTIVEFPIKRFGNLILIFYLKTSEEKEFDDIFEDFERV